jgi:adenylate cyclase
VRGRKGWRGALRRQGRARRMLLLGLAAVFAASVAYACHATDALRRIELETVDLRFAVRGDQAPPRDIAVVGIDAASFDDENITWPFKRGVHARVMDALRKDGAKVIGYDVQFTEPSPFPRQDEMLLAAVGRTAKRLVLATTEVGDDGSTGVLGGNGPAFEDLGGVIGNTIMPADPNGVRRRVPHSYQGLRSFAVAMVEQGTGQAVPKTRFGERGALIDYHGAGGTLKVVSFGDVLNGRFEPGTFKDRYVVVGGTAPSLQDLAPTSTSGDELESGPEILAESVSTILRGFPLRDAPGWITALLVALFALVPGLASLRMSTARTFLTSLGVAGLFVVAAEVAFLNGRVIETAVPLAALAIATVCTLAVQAVLEAFERQRVRDAFARFVPGTVVDEVLDSMGGEVRLGGIGRECTVLFSDLRGFTSYSESRPPDRVIEVLNLYLTEMSDAILDHGGTLISYMGDGIMAVFGTPLEQPDHRDRALATAREMLSRLETFNERMRADGSGDGFRMGIGVNTGMVMCGNVGSQRRLEYTTIGDTVNTASRIEGMTKGTPYQLFVADSTFSGLAETPPDLVFVDEMAVRGRTEGVRLWGLPDPPQPQAAEAGAPVSISISVDSVANSTPPVTEPPIELQRR